MRIVVAAPHPIHIVHGELVPLLAGDLAGFAANAKGGIGEEAL
jgi:hypothetical protein